MRQADPPHHHPRHRHHRRHSGALLDLIREVLADGRPRTPSEILTEGQARGLFPAGYVVENVTNAIHGYVGRKQLRGRKPFAVQDPDGRYRLNQIPDPWPEPSSPLPTRSPSHEALAALDVARRTATGADPAAFERAVCDVFAALGFVATHLGANDQPDGLLDAPLGALGYRVVLECKTAVPGKGVGLPNAAEPARYREPYGAERCALVGPEFTSQPVLLSELNVHCVSAWTIDDLATIVNAALNPYELRRAFEPGFAEDTLADLIWERSHGVRKRIAVISELLQKIAGHEQHIALAAKPELAAHLTVDSAMICVNEWLARHAGEARCERADVEAAFDWMTQPLVGAAVWADDAKRAIVVTSLGLSAER
ncbi:MAG: hypothetical protein JO083_05385 [Candidatus Eremiobacteraeota bacterium]|nr:hypothetical protein [Candidatus Eremiobacteraeota bacterium]MBV8370913.1 hypothetical protein [Candidatus Eremiobacteraeota bacterium]